MHEGQTRSDGSPYISHPIAVAEIIRSHTNRKLPFIAAYLHDVLEDCEHVKESIIVKLFGQQITNIVKELTLPKLIFPSGTKEERTQIKTDALVAKAIYMQPDAKWVKLADRYHNLQSARIYWKTCRTQRYAKQGLDLFHAMKPLPEGSESLQVELLFLISCILSDRKY